MLTFSAYTVKESKSTPLLWTSARCWATASRLWLLSGLSCMYCVIQTYMQTITFVHMCWDGRRARAHVRQHVCLHAHSVLITRPNIYIHTITFVHMCWDRRRARARVRQHVCLHAHSVLITRPNIYIHTITFVQMCWDRRRARAREKTIWRVLCNFDQSPAGGFKLQAYILVSGQCPVCLQCDAVSVF
jgi:hypothetical protein